MTNFNETFQSFLTIARICPLKLTYNEKIFKIPYSGFYFMRIFLSLKSYLSHYFASENFVSILTARGILSIMI